MVVFLSSFSIIMLVTTRHASWRIGQQRSSSTPVCHWPASGGCSSCSSSFTFPLPQLFARMPSADHASTFPLGSSGSRLWWWSWHPCAACAQSSTIASSWWWSPYPLAGAKPRGHSWKWFLRLVTWKDDSLALSCASTLICREGSTIRGSGRAPTCSWCCAVTTLLLFVLIPTKKLQYYWATCI